MSTAQTVTQKGNLAKSSFSTEKLAPQDKYAAWQESISVLCDVAPKNNENLDTFEAQLESYMIGPIMATRCKTKEQTFALDRKTIARIGMDHIMVQYYEHGGNIFTANGRSIRSAPGDIQVIDITQEMKIQSFASSSSIGFHVNHLFFIARKKLEALVPHIEALNGCIIPADTPLNLILRNHLQSLWQTTPMLNQHDAEAIVKPTIELIGAALGQTRDVVDSVRATLNEATLMTVRNIIDQNIGNLQLNPGFIASRVGLSRTALFRLCKPVGGVSTLIRNRRLLLARRLLSSQCSNKSIKAVAYKLGFDSQSSFGRAFKQKYGFSPSDVRDQFLSHQHTLDSHKDNYPFIGDRNYEFWLTNLVE